jgi:peptidoglycan pentaglycine glycine transferase (the first glycine)
MRNIQFRELGTDEDFDPNTLAERVPFTQANFYGAWQDALHRRVRRFVAEDSTGPRAYFQIISYPLIGKRRYLYIPYGPVVVDADDELLNKFSNVLTRIAKEENAAFVRLDFTPAVPGELLARHFKKAARSTYHSAYFQPRTEWYLPVEKSEEVLLAEMHEKTRYSIRVAERKGVTVEIITNGFTAYFEKFYELMTTTAERNKFSLHPRAYYKRIFEEMEMMSNAYLAVARYADSVLAIDLIIVWGGVANYVFGCSDDRERNRMPSYAAQWAAIREAKRRGCRFYNFGGVTSSRDEYEGWEGLTRFKRRFGGEEILHSDFYDLVAEPFWYHLYNVRKAIKSLLKR